MRLTVSSKLMLIATTTTLAFVAVVAFGVATNERQRATLAELEGRLVPKLAFGPRLEGEVARMQRAMQDAVAAQDLEALHAVGDLKQQIFQTIDRAGAALDPDDSMALRTRLEAYYVVAHDVSRRLIAGETGETLAAPVARMQDLQRQLAAALDHAVRFEHGDLTAAFAAVRNASAAARSVNLLVGICALVLVIALAFWVSRTLLEGVRALATGFARFGTGELAQPIPIATDDELGTIALEANKMAASLARSQEDLRRNNAELRAQQDALQRVNEALEAQRAELHAQNAALDVANREVQKKADEVAKVSSYKSQFLANMSHELRTPLNSMLLLSQLMAENTSQNLTAKQVEYCQTIHGAGKDLMSLINQVLDLAKIESGKQGVHVEPVPLSSFIEQAKRMFSAVAAQKQLTFDATLAPGLPDTIDTDRRRVEQVLINLLGNAIKFTTAGHVRLHIGPPTAPVTFQQSDLSVSDTIAFAVSDTGIGIPLEAQETVFLPFEQLESKTDRRYGGTGLGLAIARESVALLGGELHLESTPGKGSTFTCYLPRRSEAKANPARPNVTVRPSNVPRNADPPPRGENNLLLIIEDDVTFAEILADIARARELNVTIAHSGEEGLRLAAERRPRGIVLDVKLPDVDGWTVMERLHRDPATATIPVHFVSALDDSGRGLAMGAVGYLVKPTSREQLHGMVHALAAVMESARSRVLVVEDDVAAAHSVVALLGNDRLQTLHVRNATDAIRALAREQFDCMLLDLGLPDIDGLELLASLRARSDIHTPPVIVYTGRSLTRDEVRQLEEYAEAVVVKDGSSQQRLLDEVHLFVQQVKDGSSLFRLSRAATDAGISLAGTRILVVDDDMRTLYALSALLRSKGAEVLAADNGRAALEALEQHPTLHCVLMDITMPEIDGYEAIRRIRQQARFTALPIVALTAKAMKGERERCLEAGASVYHPKPVDGPLLLTTIHGLVRDVISSERSFVHRGEP